MVMSEQQRAKRARAPKTSSESRHTKARKTKVGSDAKQTENICVQHPVTDKGSSHWKLPIEVIIDGIAPHGVAFELRATCRELYIACHEMAHQQVKQRRKDSHKQAAINKADTRTPSFTKVNRGGICFAYIDPETRSLYLNNNYYYIRLYPKPDANPPTIYQCRNRNRWLYDGSYLLYIQAFGYVPSARLIAQRISEPPQLITPPYRVINTVFPGVILNGYILQYGRTILVRRPTNGLLQERIIINRHIVVEWTTQRNQTSAQWQRFRSESPIFQAYNSLMSEKVSDRICRFKIKLSLAHRTERLQEIVQHILTLCPDFQCVTKMDVFHETTDNTHPRYMLPSPSTISDLWSALRRAPYSWYTLAQIQADIWPTATEQDMNELVARRLVRVDTTQANRGYKCYVFGGSVARTHPFRLLDVRSDQHVLADRPYDLLINTTDTEEI